MNCAIKNLLTVMVTLVGGLLLSACPSENNSAPEGREPDSSSADNAVMKFSPFTGEFPLPINLLFDLDPTTTDFTLDIPSDSAPAIAGNQLDGWSTIAPMTAEATKDLDPATVAAAVRVFRICGDPYRFGAPTGAPIGEMVPGTDYIAGISAANLAKVIIKPLRPFPDKYDATSVAACPAGAQGNLNKGNTYVVVITNALQDVNGEPVEMSPVYELSKNPLCFYRFATDGDSDCPGTTSADPVGLTDAGRAAGLDTASDASQQSTENVRRLVNGQEALAAGISAVAANMGSPLPAIDPADIMLSYSWSPVAIDNPDTLTVPSMTRNGGGDKVPSTWDIVKANAAAAGGGQTVTLLETGLNTAALGVPMGSGRVLVGKISVPYYLSAPSQAQPTAPLTNPWQADSASSLNSNSTNLTFANPSPQKTADIEIPIFAVAPAAGVPSADYPIAIVQHGITSNRAQVVAAAEALASVGVIAIAIDLPLHGIHPDGIEKDLRSDSTALSPLNLPGERTFDVDYLTGSTPGPDGTVDSSGAHFINLSNLIVSRDNLRQAVSDLLTLRASFAGITAINPQNPSQPTLGFDNDTVSYVGHSLGGIVGGTFLALAPNMTAGSLAMAGAGIAKLLDASAAFGPVIAAGLASAGVNEGSEDYESFLYFAQAAVDSGDPANHASALAASSLPLHLIEVVGGANITSTSPVVVTVPNPGDLVVPNDAFNPQAGVETIPETGFGGTKALSDALGIGTAETQSRAAATCSPRTPPPPVLVQFDTGVHSTLLTPAGSLPDGAGGELNFDFSAENREMLTQVAGFVAGLGAAVPIDTTCTPQPPPP